MLISLHFRFGVKFRFLGAKALRFLGAKGLKSGRLAALLRQCDIQKIFQEEVQIKIQFNIQMIIRKGTHIKKILRNQLEN